MLNKQLWGAILPGGVRAKINVFAFVLLATFSLASCDDALNDITVDDTEIVTNSCQGDCKGGETPPAGG